ncbi:hypothetical protein CYB_1552 [Synechococcus sp. JA-2-3B'a(2-13)]|nr:hypothetical protein CYB_1552 [Synechococcus sp. JA-2-3B'a(2-13)]
MAITSLFALNLILRQRGSVWGSERSRTRIRTGGGTG